MNALGGAAETLRCVAPIAIEGSVNSVRGLTVLADDLPLPVGSLVSIGATRMLGEVVGFTRERTVIVMLGQTVGIRPGDRVLGEQTHQTVSVGPSMLGRVLDGLARPIDGGGPIEDGTPRLLTPEPLPALRRRPIERRLLTGVRAIDLMTTLGRGQRMGIFAGPGVGKSTLLGLIARRTEAEINVIALVGERGREVREFVEHVLTPDARRRTVVVTATGDESPLMRLRAAKAATTIAEFFRDRGKDVLLVMDSVTRFAHAQRQVGLAAGEPPTTKGYTPSVFSQLSLLLERAGAVDASGGKRGSITGLYTILVEGDDMTEPVSDAARGILDGHVILSRRLAQRAHYPAIDVLDSVSRVQPRICDAEHLAARERVLRLIALYREVEDLVQIGAYARGARPECDLALDLHGAIESLLRQRVDEESDFAKARSDLLKLGERRADGRSAPKRGDS